MISKLTPRFARGALVAVAALVLPATLAHAQDRSRSYDEFGFRAGEFTLTLGGSGNSDNSFSGGGFAVNGQLGYFVADQLELNLRQSAGYSDPGDDIGGSSWSAGTRIGADYYFNLGRFQPFVGAEVGYLYGDAVSDTFVAGPEAGVRYFVNTTTFIYASVVYEFFFDSDSDRSAFSDGQFVYNLGIGFKW